MARTRNEGGRFSKGTGWYKDVEAAWITKVESEWTARAAEEEAAYLAERMAQEERARASWVDDGEYDDGDLVPWDAAA